MEAKNEITVDGVKYVRESKAHQNADGLRYAIVRSRDQGVMCGFVAGISGRWVTLHSARQIWRYDSTFVLADIAEHGPRDASKMMMSVAMSQPCEMLEACGVLYCTDAAAKSLISIPAVEK